LTFAIAALGYCFALLKDKDFSPACSARVFMILSMLTLALSAFFGFLCAIIRLKDFQGTARRACNHPEKPSKEAMRDLDDLTWRLFYLQLFWFAIGTTALAVVLLLTYGGKLLLTGQSVQTMWHLRE
jgi:ABC-type amino acid transport system permease subunit